VNCAAARTCPVGSQQPKALSLPLYSIWHAACGNCLHCTVGESTLHCGHINIIGCVNVLLRSPSCPSSLKYSRTTAAYGLRHASAAVAAAAAACCCYSKRSEDHATAPLTCPVGPQQPEALSLLDGQVEAGHSNLQQQQQQQQQETTACLKPPTAARSSTVQQQPWCGL
jgi:hypothetical protein